MKKKNNLCTLIANDIVHYGMDMTSNFNYIVDLKEYADEFDNDTKKFILDNEDKIIEEIGLNDNIAHLVSTDHKMDMVFYYDGLMDRLEKLIYKNSQIFNKELEIEDIRTIADNILEDDNLNDEIGYKVIHCKGGYNNDI